MINIVYVIYSISFNFSLISLDNVVGNLTVKLIIALLMLIPFRILIKNIKDYSQNT